MINHTATRTVESWKLKGKAFAELPSDDLTMLYHDAPAAKAMRMTMPTGPTGAYSLRKLKQALEIKWSHNYLINLT